MPAVMFVSNGVGTRFRARLHGPGCNLASHGARAGGIFEFEIELERHGAGKHENPARHPSKACSSRSMPRKTWCRSMAWPGPRGCSRACQYCTVNWSWWLRIAAQLSMPGCLGANGHILDVFIHPLSRCRSAVAVFRPQHMAIRPRPFRRRRAVAPCGKWQVDLVPGAL